MVRSLVGMHVITLVTAFRSLEMATEKAAFSAKQCLTGQLNLMKFALVGGRLFRVPRT